MPDNSVSCMCRYMEETEMIHMEGQRWVTLDGGIMGDWVILLSLIIHL